MKVVCEEVEAEHMQATGQTVKLSTSTLSDHITGKSKPKLEAASERSWLNKEETDLVVQFAIECAHIGFPLTSDHLRAHCNEIARRQHGDKFPAEGVASGKNWVDRFVERNHTKLHKYLSRPIDATRAQAANPHANAEWFKLLGETIKKYDIQPDCIYGTDESGFMMGLHQRWMVIGEAGKMQYEQHGKI